MNNTVPLSKLIQCVIHGDKDGFHELLMECPATPEFKRKVLFDGPLAQKLDLLQLAIMHCETDKRLIEYLLQECRIDPTTQISYDILRVILSKPLLIRMQILQCMLEAGWDTTFLLSAKSNSILTEYSMLKAFLELPIELQQRLSFGNLQLRLDISSFDESKDDEEYLLKLLVENDHLLANGLKGSDKKPSTTTNAEIATSNEKQNTIRYVRDSDLDGWIDNLFFYCVRYNWIQLTRYLLGQGVFDINMIYKYDSSRTRTTEATLLWFAIEWNHCELAKILIEEGNADVNISAISKKREGYLPSRFDTAKIVEPIVYPSLLYAAAAVSSNCDFLYYLMETYHLQLDLDTSVKLVDKVSSVEEIQRVFPWNIDCNKISSIEGYSIVGKAISCGNDALFQRFKYLIDWSVPQTSNGDTALHLLVRKMKIEELRLLQFNSIVIKQVNVFAVNNNDETALDLIRSRFETKWGSSTYKCRQQDRSIKKKSNSKAVNQEGNDKRNDKDNIKEEPMECPCCIHHKTTLTMQSLMIQLLEQQHKEAT